MALRPFVVGVGLIALVAFGLFVWPTPYRYDHIHYEASTLVVLINRITGGAKELGRYGWRQIGGLATRLAVVGRRRIAVAHWCAARLGRAAGEASCIGGGRTTQPTADPEHRDQPRRRRGACPTVGESDRGFAFGSTVRHMECEFLMGLILGLVYPPATKWNEWLSGMALLFVYCCFIEPILLTMLGTTPGKALLAIDEKRSRAIGCLLVRP